MIHMYVYVEVCKKMLTELRKGTGILHIDGIGTNSKMSILNKCIAGHARLKSQTLPLPPSSFVLEIC